MGFLKKEVVYMDNKGKIVRYILVVIIYNTIISIIAFVLDSINDALFQLSYTNWELTEWFLVISVMVLIGGLMLYLAPYFNLWLYYKLELRLVKIKEKLKENEHS